jgi:hypothetical protein
MFSTQTAQNLDNCHACGAPTPGHDVSDLADGFLNLCDTDKAQWQAEDDAKTAYYVEHVQA